MTARELFNRITHRDYDAYLSRTGQDGAAVPELLRPAELVDVVEEPDAPVTAPGLPQRFMWVIDWGHGPLTAGKRSPAYADGYVMLEYKFNLAVARHVTERLTDLGISHGVTMPFDGNHGNALPERVKAANAICATSDLPCRGVSIHANAGPAPTSGSHWNKGTMGVETWHHSKSTLGRNMAAIFQRHLMKAYAHHLQLHHPGMKAKDRGLRFKTVGEFYVLRYTTAPFVLTEGPGMNYAADADLLRDPAFRIAWAEAHVATIIEIENTGAPMTYATFAAAPTPDELRAWLALASFARSLFGRNSPLEKWQAKRTHYVRSLQRREGRGKINEATYHRHLATWDETNPKPKTY